MSHHTVLPKIDLTAWQKAGQTPELTAVHIIVKVLMFQSSGKLHWQLQIDINPMENKEDIGNTLICYCAIKKVKIMELHILPSVL